MDSILKSFRHSRLAIGASLGCAIGVDFLKVHPTLPTNPFQQTQECSKRCVNAFFPEHPSIESNSVQIFCKNSLRLVAKLVGIFQMKVFATDGDMVMKFGYLNLCFFQFLEPFSFLAALRCSTFSLPCRVLKNFGRST
jgi:hypothetical protein